MFIIPQEPYILMKFFTLVARGCLNICYAYTLQKISARSLCKQPLYVCMIDTQQSSFSVYRKCIIKCLYKPNRIDPTIGILANYDFRNISRNKKKS